MYHKRNIVTLERVQACTDPDEAVKLYRMYKRQIQDKHKACNQQNVLKEDDCKNARAKQYLEDRKEVPLIDPYILERQEQQARILKNLDEQLGAAKQLEIDIKAKNMEIDRKNKQLWKETYESLTDEEKNAWDRETRDRFILNIFNEELTLPDFIEAFRSKKEQSSTETNQTIVETKKASVETKQVNTKTKQAKMEEVQF